MKFVIEIIISFIFAIIYVIFIHKTADVIFTNMNSNDKYQYSLILFISVGIAGIVLAETVFTNNNILKNIIIKYGLIIGGIILLLYPTLTYWNKMTNQTKLIVAGVALAAIIWYCYKYYYNTDTETKKKLKSKSKLDK